MTKCLRCGAGSEWIKGRVPMMSRDDEVDQLRQQLAEYQRDHEAMEALIRLAETCYIDIRRVYGCPCVNWVVNNQNDMTLRGAILKAAKAGGGK